MITIENRILEYLHDYPDGLDDDQISDALSIKPRQSVNQACRRLESEGKLRRVKLYGPKIRNYLIGGQEPQLKMLVIPDLSSEGPWHTEAKVQRVVMNWLTSKGCEVKSFADAATKERGVDIIATKPDGSVLYITVKGFPEKTATKKTHPSTQAGHWFKDGFHDLLEWRGESKETNLAFALPDFKRYRALADKVIWIKPILGFSFYWVSENDSITEE